MTLAPLQAVKFNKVWKCWISSAKFSAMKSHVAFGHYHRFVNQINFEAVKCILKRESWRLHKSSLDRLDVAFFIKLRLSRIGHVSS